MHQRKRGKPLQLFRGVWRRRLRLISPERPRADRRQGMEAVIVDPKGDWSSEYTIIENLITQQVDGIIYTAIDAEGANDIVRKVQDAGIPIVGYDCLASDGTEDAAVRYDDYKGDEWRRNRPWRHWKEKKMRKS